MKQPVAALSGLTLIACLAACGGGSSPTNTETATDTTTTSPSVVANSIARYAGSYVSACERIDEVVNLDLGGPVYALTYSTVAPLDQRTANFSFRFDFYADANCSAAPLGSLANANPGNRVTIVGAIQEPFATADKVQYTIQPPNVTFTASATADTVVYGSAIHLALPSRLVQGWASKDLWRLGDGRLSEGGTDLDRDGFPLNTDPAYFSEQVASIPAAPPEPCGSQLLTWTSWSATCSAPAPVSLSGSAQIWMDDTSAPTTGRASASCVNGAWTAPVSSYCNDASPPVPRCTARTWTWTVDGNTCSGTSPDDYGAGNHSASNVIAGFMGGKSVSCVATAGGGFEWTEFIFPSFPTTKIESCSVVVPPPPPTTDPLQLVTQKNCLLCHAVQDGGGGFLSFQTIASHYRNNPPAAGVLEAKIKNGGIGVFLNFPMPANPQISDSELAILVPWILSR